MAEIQYPVRCEIVDPKGTYLGAHERVAPSVSLPHIGKQGLAELLDEWTVKILLDDGTVLYGHECWWTPIAAPPQSEERE